MASLTVDFRKHRGPTPSDDMAAQIITDCGNFTLDFKNMDSVSSILPPDSGTLIYKLNAKCTLIWKEDFGPLSNSPVIFLFSPGKMLRTMFLFQTWLGSSFPEDVWAWWLLMHWLQLQFTSCEALPSVWIGFTWQYSQACSHSCCLCTFSYPISSFQSNLHLICFDTALLEQPPLSVMTSVTYSLCGGRQWSSSGPLPSQQCSPLLCFQRTRDTQNLYCIDGHI